MALLECEVTLHTPRIYRNNDGVATGVFVLAEGRPVPVQGSQDEPAFSGGSYVRFELFLDNAREVDSLTEGKRLTLSLNVPEQGGE